MSATWQMVGSVAWTVAGVLFVAVGVQQIIYQRRLFRHARHRLDKMHEASMRKIEGWTAPEERPS